MPEFKYDVFLSYARTDSSFVDWLHRRLRVEKIRVWRDLRRISVGDQIHNGIREGILNCRLVLCVVSSAYQTSDWCREEARLALEAESAGAGVEVLPLRIDESDPGTIFPRTAWADFRDRANAKSSLEDLLRAISMRLEVSKPGESPYFDDLGAYQIWTPWRAVAWERCRKQFWYEYLVPAQKFSLEPKHLGLLLSLRNSRSIGGRLGYRLRTEMRRHLKGKGASVAEFQESLKDLMQGAAEIPSGLIEVNNVVPKLDDRIRRSVDVAVGRYTHWVDSLADEWKSWYIFPPAPTYRQAFRDWRIYLKYQPFAERGHGREVLFIENFRTERVEKRARRRFLSYLLARLRAPRRDENEFRAMTALQSQAYVLYMDGGEVSRFDATEDQISLHERRLWAAAERFSRSRRIHPVIAQPRVSLCSHCKFLSVCQDGQGAVGREFDEPLIPSQYDQARATLVHQDILRNLEDRKPVRRRVVQQLEIDF